MALFGRNPNESAYVGGKKHWTDVIKNSGPGEFLIWRQPEEDFNNNSTLVVMPGEAAIFIDRGQIVQIFNENGTYQLSTENYPFISRLRNAFSGGVSTFNSVVYFVRKAVSKELLWGTAGRINVRDKVWKFRTDIGARGAFKVAVDQPGVFLEKLLGNNVPYQTQNEIFDYFGEELQAKIVSTLSNFFNNQWPSELIGIEACLMDLAAYLKPQINEMFKEYGIRCESFVISGLNLDTSKYDQVDDAQIELNKAEVLGDKYATLTAAEILKILASNPGSGGAAAAAGAGIGMGMAAGNTFATLADRFFESFAGSRKTEEVPLSFMNGQVGSGRFTQAGSGTVPLSTPAPVMQQTSAPAAAPAQQDEDPDIAALTKLKTMLEKGLITQQIYDDKLAEILARM